MEGTAFFYRQEGQGARDETLAESDADVEARLSAVHVAGQPASHVELLEAHFDYEAG